MACVFYGFSGSLCTEAFDSYSRKVYEADWYLLPVNLQKYTILMIGNANQPLYFHGMNLFLAELPTCAKVSLIEIH